MTIRLVSAFPLFLFLASLFSVSNVTSVGKPATATIQSANSVSAYENLTTHEGDLIIDGTETLVIENCTYVQTGNIFVSDHARLVFHNAVFVMNQTYHYEFQLKIENWATLDAANLTIGGSWEFALSVADDSQVSVSNSTTEGMAITSWGQSAISIDNCQLRQATLTDNARMHISNSTFSWVIILRFIGQGDSIFEGLKPGFFEYWSLRQNQSEADSGFNLELANTFVADWSLEFSYNSKAVVRNSVVDRMWVSYHATSARIEGLRPGFHVDWSLGNITLQNTRIGHWVLDVFDSLTEFAETEATIITSGVSNVSIMQSDNLTLHTATMFHGMIGLNQSSLNIVEGFVDSEFYIYGKIDNIGRTRFWVLSNVTRNYKIILKDRNDTPGEDVELTLINQADNVVWNGITDSSGLTFFNLTFSDDNHTDSLRLTAFKEGFYNSSQRVSFFSGTPIVFNLTQRLLSDVNEDRVVNILDISLVARSFGSVEGDEKWNKTCDLNEDAEINILDITRVAKDYGKLAE